MPGLTCNCSRCGILLRLMHPAAPGAPILCGHCAELRDAASRELPRARVVPEQPSQPPRAEEATTPVVGGLVEDRAWERLQARQRKKALRASLMAMGGLIMLLLIGLLIGSAGGVSKKKEREKQSDWDRPLSPRQPEEGAGRPRREEEEDPNAGRPLRPIPVPDR